jgi:hypothetical protein
MESSNSEEDHPSSPHESTSSQATRNLQIAAVAMTERESSDNTTDASTSTTTQGETSQQAASINPATPEASAATSSTTTDLVPQTPIEGLLEQHTEQSPPPPADTFQASSFLGGTPDQIFPIQYHPPLPRLDLYYPRYPPANIARESYCDASTQSFGYHGEHEGRCLLPLPAAWGSRNPYTSPATITDTYIDGCGRLK